MGRTLAWVCVLLSLFVREGVAQPSDSILRGMVRDQQGAPLPGASVSVETFDRGIVQTVASDAQGHYRIPQLPPAVYAVRVSLTGFFTTVREGVALRAGADSRLDLELRVGGPQETVVVTSDTPILHDGSVHAVNARGSFLDAIPLAPHRHWSEVLRVVPGVVARDATINPAPVFYIRGAGFVSFSTLIDGADMSSAVNPWTGYVAIPGAAINDVEVKIAGFDASVPLGMGAATNVVTKAGSNVFKGTAVIVLTPQRWIANNTPGGTSSTMSLAQPEMSFGGPIRQNRFWFFGAYRYRSGTFGIDRSSSQLAAQTALAPGFTPFDNHIRAQIGFVKLTGQLHARHQVSGFFNRDRTPYENNGSFATGRFGRTAIGGSGYSVRLASMWSDRVAGQVTGSWNDKSSVGELLHPDRTSRVVFGTTNASAGRLVGVTPLAILDSAESASGSPYTKWTVAADVTTLKSGWLGSHELQAGVFLQPRMTRRVVTQYSGQGRALEEHVPVDMRDPGAGTVPFHRRVYETAQGVTAAGRIGDNAVYVQDAWRPASPITVTAGLRVDQITRRDTLFGVNLQESVELGPRIGMSVIPMPRAGSVVRFSWARVHEAATVNHQSAGTVTIGFTDSYDLDQDGTFETTLATPAASALNPNVRIDPSYHQPYMDEWALGYRQNLPGRLVADVGFVHRAYRDRTALVEQNGIYDGGVFQGYRDHSLNEIFLLTSNRWNWPVYRSFEAAATRDTERLAFIASYTRVWPRMAGTWQPNDPASFIQPDAFPWSRGLASNDNRAATIGNSFTVGPGSIEWTEHVARVSAFYRAPWRFGAGLTYATQAGRWSGPVLTNLPRPDPALGPPLVTLANGRVVSNPLATTTRFAFSTRSDGQFKLSPVHVLNARVSREVPLGSAARLVVDLDLFNVANLSGHQGFQSGANQLFSANYGKGAEVQPPRTAQLAIRVEF